MRKSVWLTYAWKDNEEKSVDFIAQELGKVLDIKLDRWNLIAGKHLWDQISSFIQDPEKSDGWLFYATESSVGNKKCKEEFYLALERALDSRKKDFPIIALFPKRIDEELIPPNIKIRLYVNLDDPAWVEKVLAGVEGRSPSVEKQIIEPYYAKVHKLAKPINDFKYVIEVRPRIGTWAFFEAGIPLEEETRVSPNLSYGPANQIPTHPVLLINTGTGEGREKGTDRKIFIMFAQNEASCKASYYINCKELPSFLIFGEKGGAYYKFETRGAL